MKANGRSREGHRPTITITLPAEVLAIVRECASRERSEAMAIAMRQHADRIAQAIALLKAAELEAAAVHSAMCDPLELARYDDPAVLRSIALLQGSPLGRARVVAWQDEGRDGD